MPSTNVRSYTDTQLIDRVESLSTFRGWVKGKYDIWVRSSEDEYNRFDDKVYSFECFEDGERPKFIMVCSGTTNAGSQGLKNFEKYNRLGCAVMKSDVIVYKSHQLGKHKGKYWAYVQSYSVGFPYYRDNNKDNKSDEVGRVYRNRIGANCHKAGDYSTQIGGWSVACLVRNIKKQYLKWMKWMDKNQYLNVAILKEWDD